MFMRRRQLVFSIWMAAMAACGADGASVRGGGDAGGGSARAVEPSPDGPAVPQPEPFAADVVSLRLKRSIVVRFTPDENGKPIGTVAQDTRVRWTALAFGPGCERWVEIEPRGWVCDRYLEPSKKPPAGVELPRLKEGELVPGTYARVIAGGADAFKTLADVTRKKPARRLPALVKLRHVDDEVVGGKLYWKTTEGEYVEFARLKRLEPSTFVGVTLGDGLGVAPGAGPADASGGGPGVALDGGPGDGSADAPGVDGALALPLAWAQSRRDMGVYVQVKSTPGGALVRSLKPRTVVQIIESSGDGQWHRIIARGRPEVTGWIAAADLHIARLTPPPPTTGEHEKWLDVDLDEQVVVAYDGVQPVYATLTSSGSKKWPTVPGNYRIWIKFAETNMSGQMGDEDPYSVATVPWTMFFARDLAFHTAYWHDKFGEARSHGCLNLSPRDARALYFWATPEVPVGWSMAYGIVERPGATVRIRSLAAPDPPFLGYAKRVHEARLARLGGLLPVPVPVEPSAPELQPPPPPSAPEPAPAAPPPPEPVPAATTAPPDPGS